MNIRRPHTLLHLVFGTALSFAFGSPLEAQVRINQARALSGGVTPGDAPGFPVTINRVGSYILTSNLTLPSSSGTVGIDINRESVTIDLNGFSIIGPRVCPDDENFPCPPGIEDLGFFGIRGGNNVTILNGTVRGSLGWGISVGAHARIERVNVLWSSFFGILAGRGSIINECLAAQNGEGIVGASKGKVTNCVVKANTFAGLDLADAGYAGNVVTCSAAFSCVFGGIQMGPNLCNGSPCP
ncbi:MAG: right-handed parallel beta-helix repeat-containing protein [Acidobacteria bacterium]|nr:right-handed parallel beta-helix repeat-containing protein [Acidobacteriota bacterium]